MRWEEETLSTARIVAAVEAAGLFPLAEGVAERFQTYFGLLRRWNAKLNLTSIRSAEETLERHFVECIFCAQQLPGGIGTLLDYGSGAGFPGIPIALCRPEIRVTLAESQGKKAGFLREAARVLGLGLEVYAGRVEGMEADRVFDAVALRAVEGMQEAIGVAALRVKTGGWLVLLCGAGSMDLPESFCGVEKIVPGSTRRVLMVAGGASVPRET